MSIRVVKIISIILVVLLTACSNDTMINDEIIDPFEMIEESVTYYHVNDEVIDRVVALFNEQEVFKYYLNHHEMDKPKVEVYNANLEIYAQKQDRPTFMVWQSNNGEWKYYYDMTYEYDFKYTKNGTIRDSNIMFRNVVGDIDFECNSHDDPIYLYANNQKFYLRVIDDQIRTSDNSEQLHFCKDLEKNILYYFNEYDVHCLNVDNGFANSVITIIEEYGDKENTNYTHYYFDNKTYSNDIISLYIDSDGTYVLNGKTGYWETGNNHLIINYDEDYYVFDVKEDRLIYLKEYSKVNEKIILDDGMQLIMQENLS